MNWKFILLRKVFTVDKSEITSLFWYRLRTRLNLYSEIVLYGLQNWPQLIHCSRANLFKAAFALYAFFVPLYQPILMTIEFFPLWLRTCLFWRSSILTKIEFLEGNVTWAIDASKIFYIHFLCYLISLPNLAAQKIKIKLLLQYESDCNVYEINKRK